MTSILCATCLATDVRMISLKNTAYQELIGKFADTKINLEETRLNNLCYICYSQLQKCFRFMHMSRNNQTILEKIYNNGMQFTQDSITLLDKKPNGFVTKIITTYDIEILENCETNSSTYNVMDIINEPVQKIKEEVLEITDIVQEELLPIKPDPTQGEECLSNTQQPIKDENNKDLKESPDLMKNMSSKINSYIDRTIMMSYCQIKPLAYKPVINDMGLLNPIKRLYKKRLRRTSYPCHSCDMTFTCQGYLNRHLRVHTGEKPYICDDCHRSFSQKSHLIQHMRCHTGEKPYNCHICKNKAFNHLYNYKTHLKKHFSDKTNKCEVCTAKFHTKADLKRHSLTHTGEKPFTCEFCNTKFSQKGHMNKHINMFHSGPHESTSTDLPNDKDFLRQVINVI